METEKQKNIKALELLATKVLELKIEKGQRRPLLIEFCGSPKSGKSTTINSLNIFLKRNGFKTMILTERASICPIDNKEHPFFNIWTLSSAVAEIVKNLDLGKDNVDIIISDRGLFDSLCWFEWLNKNEKLDDKTYTTLTDFVLMDLWKKQLDLVYVFKVDPKTSIKREYANLLTEKRGSIMRESVLSSFNNSIDTIVQKHKKNFRNVQEIKTDTEDTDNNPNGVGYKVTLSILETLQNLLIEKVGYIENSDFDEDSIDIESLSLKTLKFGNRDDVEKTNNIQPIPIAVITNKERSKVLVVKKGLKRTLKDSPEHDKLLLYIGGHIREEDKEKNKKHTTLLSTVKQALHREIQEEIGESIDLHNNTPFLIYKNDNEKSKQHLAICFVVEMDLEDKRFKLTSDEFVMKTGKSKSGHVLEIKEITKGDEKFESWSIEILKKVFSKDVSKQKNILFPTE